LTFAVDNSEAVLLEKLLEFLVHCSKQDLRPQHLTMKFLLLWVETWMTGFFIRIGRPPFNTQHNTYNTFSVLRHQLTIFPSLDDDFLQAGFLFFLGICQRSLEKLVLQHAERT